MIRVWYHTFVSTWWILRPTDRTRKCMIRVWHHKFMSMWDIGVAPPHINPSCPKELIYTFLFEFGHVFITLQQFWWILMAADRTKCMLRVWHHKFMSMWDRRVAPPHINPSCPKVFICTFNTGVWFVFFIEMLQWILVPSHTTQYALWFYLHNKFLPMRDILFIPPYINPSCPKVLIHTMVLGKCMMQMIGLINV